MRSLSLIIRIVDFGDLMPLFKDIADQDFGGKLEFILVGDASERVKLTLGKGWDCRRLLLDTAMLERSDMLNLAAEAARGDVLLYTVSDAKSLTRHRLQSAVEDRGHLCAGLCGPIMPAAEAKISEQVYTHLVYADARMRGVLRLDQPVPEFSALNMALPRWLWKSQPFREGLALDDAARDWLGVAFGRGYDLIFDRRFGIRYTRDLDWSNVWQALCHRPSGQMVDGLSAMSRR